MTESDRRSACEQLLEKLTEGEPLSFSGHEFCLKELDAFATRMQQEALTSAAEVASTYDSAQLRKSYWDDGFSSGYHAARTSIVDMLRARASQVGAGVQPIS